MKRYLTLICIAFFSIQAYSQSLQSPEEFLGYKLGERFTPHHRVIAYYEYVAGLMPNMKIEKYGETNEHRPLIVAYLSSQANFDRLDQIRENNLKRAGLLDGQAITDDIAIVWLSYNVHGNEASSSEATMLTLYELANPGNSTTQKWLENTIVIMDPCVNPDGRDRYANFFNQYGNKIPNPDPDSREHNEPWPGGRPNHYLFDLNRDWAWISQAESRQRIALYNEWMPHVHVDFHEMGMNRPYFFPPSAQPFHEIITPWQRQFQEFVGKNHAKYFDAQGWLYFTKEDYDLFYPSYGDTYPTYNGAIGMTYEKGGGGSAGLGGMMNNGDTVTLHDRLIHHHTTGLSTVEVSSMNAAKLVSEFSAYHNKANNNPGSKYKTYLIKGTNNPDKLRALSEWLTSHKIRYGSAKGASKLTGFGYRNRSNSAVTIASGDMIVSAYQPKSNLVEVLFEPQSNLVDSMTYDITAWAVPYIYDLEAYALTERINISSEFTLAKTDVSLDISEKVYAYVARYESLQDQKWMSYLLNKGVKFRVADVDFNLQGENYKKGTLIALRWDNQHLKGFGQLVQEATTKFGQETKVVNTGFVNQGKDFGSGDYFLINSPKVAVLSGSSVRSLSFGEVWYFFEQEIEYPLTVLDTEYFSSVDLSKYDVLVIPNGSYNRIFNEGTRKELQEWVRNGGRLVLMGGALRSFVDTDQFGLRRYFSDKEENAAEDREEKLEEANMLTDYEDAVRMRISNETPGAIYKVKMDNSHPLAFGYRDQYFTLKRDASGYAYLKEGGNVGIIESSKDLVSGFVGKNVKESVAQTLVFGVEDIGRGSVVYMVDNPLFRAFWYNGKMLFGNAVFMK